MKKVTLKKKHAKMKPMALLMEVYDILKVNGQKSIGEIADILDARGIKFSEEGLFDIMKTDIPLHFGMRRHDGEWLVLS